MKGRPFFKHDCDLCRFIGRAQYGGAVADWYHCSSASDAGTILARYGDDAPQYSSGPVDLLRRDVNTEAPLFGTERYQYSAFQIIGLHLLDLNGGGGEMTMRRNDSVETFERVMVAAIRASFGIRNTRVFLNSARHARMRQHRRESIRRQLAALRMARDPAARGLVARAIAGCALG